MNVYDAIMTRRSTRRFQQKTVPDELLTKLVQAGRFAPSGGNSQSTHFFVITDPDVLAELANLVQQAFAGMEVTEGMYASMASSINRSKKGGYVFHYGCPALIVTANLKDYGNNIADCACALENMMILGNELDLGTCWINQLKWLNEDPALLRKFREFGLRDDERIYGALAVGYAANENGMPDRMPLERKGNEVTLVK
ncbi:MAG: nitroreductase [Erysipelotrichaceae bacterium]|nr:nitroreductase [Erysipelotrichaceae bacterium]